MHLDHEIFLQLPKWYFRCINKELDFNIEYIQIFLGGKDYRY